MKNVYRITIKESLYIVILYNFKGLDTPKTAASILHAFLCSFTVYDARVVFVMLLFEVLPFTNDAL